MQKPLAVAVIGGLSVSTIFTLIVAPVLYVASENFKGPLTERLAIAESDFASIESEVEKFVKE